MTVLSDEERQARVAAITELMLVAPPSVVTDGEVLVSAYMGSRAHGTYVPNTIDDIDIFGVFIPGVYSIIGIENVNHWQKIVDPYDFVFYGVTKFFKMCLNGNPNATPLLFLREQEYITATKSFEDIYARRDIFLSQKMARSFVGYADAQIQDMRKSVKRPDMGAKRRELVEKYGYDTKYAAHGLRLLTMGCELYETGKVNVYREHDGADFIAIKQGQWSYEEVNKTASELFARATAARATTALPPEPDTEAANELLALVVLDFLLRRLQDSLAAAEEPEPKSRLILPGEVITPVGYR